MPRKDRSECIVRKCNKSDVNKISFPEKFINGKINPTFSEWCDLVGILPQNVM